MRRLLCRMLAVLLTLCALCACALAENAPYDPEKADSIIAWIKEERPRQLDLGQTALTLQELCTVKDALPEDAGFTFTFKHSQVWIDSTAELVDLDQKTGKVTGQDLEDMIYLMPNVTRINVFKHTNLNNKVMCPIVDAYPEVFFGWTVQFGRDGKKYQIRSDATAFSTAKGHYKPMFTSEELSVLRYVPNLKAIDVGHNHVRELDWLTSFPDLRVLILADNQVTDLTPLAQLKNLEYAELFLNDIKDITPLAGLTRLVDLNLCHNDDLSDLSALDGLTQLERFFCSYTSVSTEEAARFESLHPKCVTNWEVYSSVSAHWREHWRYFQFIDMFKTRVWREFEAPVQ